MTDVKKALVVALRLHSDCLDRKRLIEREYPHRRVRKADIATWAQNLADLSMRKANEITAVLGKYNLPVSLRPVLPDQKPKKARKDHTYETVVADWVREAVESAVPRP